jgi:hypothetical protein
MLSLALAAALSLTDPTGTAITLPAQPSPLHGTMLAPEGETRAAAVIVAGSGPTDRNGDSLQFGITAGSYRLLAEGLARQGIATVRYDKRGIAGSVAAGMAEADLRFDMYIEDARAWAAETARLTGRSCVWLIGHSEGSMIALAAARYNDQVCGVVSLAGAGRPVPVVLREQLQAVPEPLRAQAMRAVADLEAGRTTDNVPGLESLFRPSVQPYLISWFTLDPAALAAGYGRPLFIGQGSTDIQTSLADGRALKAAQPDATLVIWEGVNHLLKIAPADRAANAATYADPELPLADGVVGAVAEFILQAR